MNLKPLHALAGAAVLAMAATSANAAVTFIGYGTGLGEGETLITDFEGGPTLADVVLAQPGFTLSGDAELFTGSINGLTAAPAFSAETRDATQYLSLTGASQAAVLTTPGVQALSFYVGSLDSYNSFTFQLADGTSQVVTGAMLAELPGMAANGNQTGFTTNGRLTFSFDSAITQATFQSGGAALEISDIAAVTLVPEPATWAMMILGFGGVGGLLRQRRAGLLAA